MKKFLSLFLLVLVMSFGLITSTQASDYATPVPPSDISVQGKHDGGGGYDGPFCHVPEGKGTPETKYNGWNGHKDHPNDYKGPCVQPTVVPTTPAQASITGLNVFCDGNSIKVQAYLSNPDPNGDQVIFTFDQGPTKTHNQDWTVEKVLDGPTYQNITYTGTVSVNGSSQSWSHAGCQAPPPSVRIDSLNGDCWGGSDLHIGVNISNPDFAGTLTVTLSDGQTQTVTQNYYVALTFGNTLNNVSYTVTAVAGSATKTITVSGCGNPTPPTVEPTIPPTVEPTLEPTLESTVEPTIEPTTEPTIPPTPVVTRLVSLDVFCVNAFSGDLMLTALVENPNDQLLILTNSQGMTSVVQEEDGSTLMVAELNTLIGQTYSGTVSLGDVTLEWSHDGCGEDIPPATPPTEPDASPVPPTVVPTTPPTEPDQATPIVDKTPTEVVSETPVTETPTETPDEETPTELAASPTMPVVTTPVVIIGTPIDVTQTPDSETVTTPDEVTIVSGLPSTGQTGADTDDDLQISGGDVVFILVVILLILLIVYVWKFIRLK